MAHMPNVDIQRADVYTNVPLKQNRDRQVLDAAVRLHAETGSVPTSDQVARRMRYNGIHVSPNAVEVAQRHIRATTTTTNLGTGKTIQGMSREQLGRVVANAQKMQVAEVQTRKKGHRVVPKITITRRP